jgi:hypothetical protein
VPASLTTLLESCKPHAFIAFIPHPETDRAVQSEASLRLPVFPMYVRYLWQFGEHMLIGSFTALVQVFGRRQWRTAPHARRPASEKRQGTKSRGGEALSVPPALWGFGRGVTTR